MNKKYILVPVLGAALFLSACEGDDGAEGPMGAMGAMGAAGADGFNTLSVFRNLAIGDADCLGGGTAVDSGLDLDRDGVLDADEITDTFFTECAVTPVLRAVHASASSPAVNVVVDGVEVLSDVEFSTGSGFAPAGLAENVVEDFGVRVALTVNAQLPNDVQAPVLEIPVDAGFLFFDTETTFIVTGDPDEGLPLQGVAVSNPLGEEIAAGTFRIQVVHAADDAPPVDVYVTALDGDLTMPFNGDTPLGFSEFTEQAEVLAGSYRIRIAVPGDTPTVVFDTGAETAISLEAGADLMIVAVDNPSFSDAAVQLVVLDGTASSTVFDTNIGALAFAVHLSPDAGAVDILADAASTAENDALKLVDNVSYTGACLIGDNIAPDSYTLDVVATGGTESALQFGYDAVTREATTLVVTGFAGSQALQAITLPITDPVYRPLESRVRLTHSSPSTGNVDIYLLPAGGDINAADPNFTNVALGDSTPFLSLAPSPETGYDVYVTATGSKDPAIEVTPLLLNGGDFYDIFAIDPVGEEVGPQVLALNYDSDELGACIPET